jgi:hypothetical protein
MNEDVFRMATGGIVSRATRALIGEAGPEAVVPCFSVLSFPAFYKLLGYLSLRSKLTRCGEPMVSGNPVLSLRR